MSDISFDRLSSTKFEEFCFDLLSASGFVNVDWRKGTGLRACNKTYFHDGLGSWGRSIGA
jgi:hypothetical protein